MEPIDINRLISIDRIDYVDCFPMIDFHRLGRPENNAFTGAGEATSHTFS